VKPRTASAKRVMKAVKATKKTGVPARASGKLYGRVRQILESARAGAARSVNTAQVIANWMVGREIVVEEQKGSARAGYAEGLVAQLSERLTAEYGTGYSSPNLWHMRRFQLMYPALLSEEEILYAVRRELGRGERLSKDSAGSRILDAVRRESGRSETRPSISEKEIGSAVRGASSVWRPGQLHPSLSWTHYRSLLKVEREAARAFYEIEAVQQSWSARELERQIDSLLFERLAKSRDKRGLMRLAAEGQSKVQAVDIFKDPTVIEFLGLPESPRLVESELEQALIDHLQKFLLELGSGFAFVARQQRITLEGDHFYIDLVFYHTVLKCYVLIDLKAGKLAHADLGQIQFYVNYFDRERRTKGDNPTLGLILCSDKNEAVVRYTLGEPQKRKIFASRYQLYLPSEKELKDELRKEMRELSAAQIEGPVPRANKKRRG
jgi:predicted nuclease of restriction endonuclease-like (RecB) superfamily